MSEFTDSAKSKAIDQREHNNDASAKRVIPRAMNMNTGDYQAFPLPAIDSQFDYIGIVNNSETQDTLTYKIGGSGGTTVKTLVITYAASASKISDDLASLAFS